MGTQQKSELRKKGREYQPGGKNLLQKIFERHFSDFVKVYEDADRYGTRNAVMIISDRLAVKVSIFARHAVRKEQYLWQNI